MPAGTLTLTNNSAIVKGTGTVFNTELKAGDFIVSAVGGVTYTLPVKTVDSVTQVTLIKAYDGPTQAGAAWYAVPREMQNSITAQLVSEATKAMRGMNYDKQNWQQFFTADGDVTITLPDNSQSTGPSAKKLISSVTNKANKGANSDITSLSGLTTALSVSQGGTGAKDAATARSNLGLGSAATANIGANLNQVMLNGAWGIGGGWSGYQSLNTPDINQLPGTMGERGIIAFRNNTNITSPGWQTPAWGPSIWVRTQDVYAVFNMASTEAHLSVSTGHTATGWNQHKVIWHSMNTVVDGNGFIKKASPVTNIFGDGTCENNKEAEGVNCKRLGVGLYHVDGCLGFYIDNGWKFEVPKDENGNALLWVDYKVEKDGSIFFKTYHRTNECPIPELQNNVDGYNNGDPIDISEGRFLMVRLNVPNSQFAEYVPDDLMPRSFNGPDVE